MRTVFFIFLLCCSCSLGKKSCLVKFHPTKDRPAILMRIPTGYKLSIVSGGNEYYEYRYVYADSSCIYITDKRTNSLNEPNIINIGKQEMLFRFYTGDISELELDGKDSRGLYWKSYSRGIYNVGYMFVPRIRKEEFDNVLRSLQFK